jgi:hypothetical protein
MVAAQRRSVAAVDAASLLVVAITGHCVTQLNWTQRSSNAVVVVSAMVDLLGVISCVFKCVTGLLKQRSWKAEA